METGGMDQYEANDICKAVAASGDGYFLIRDVEAAGVPREYAYRFLADTHYEKAAKGIFYQPGIDLDRMFVIYLRHRTIVYSHESALYLYGFLAKELLPRTVTVQQGYHSDLLLDKNVSIIQIRKDLVGEGRIMMKTRQGHEVPVYDPERTIVDLIRREKYIDPMLYRDALQNYADGRRFRKNPDALRRYATLLRVSQKVERLFDTFQIV